MEKHSYPGYSAHKEQLQGFVGNFLKLKEELTEKGPASYLIIRCNKLLVDWLLNHIRKVDKGMAEFLKSAGQ